MFNVGTATVTNSTIANNGNLSNPGGGIHNSGTLTVLNSTINGNSATVGGNIYNQGTITIRNSTLSDGFAFSGAGGIHSATGTVSLRNSIVVASGGPGPNCVGVTSLGNNLSDTDDCFTGDSHANIQSSSPGLAPLALNAPGTTKTHALLPGSPAIDGVTDDPTDCPAADQRGVLRPRGVTAFLCDIGAFELEGGAPAIQPIGAQATNEDTPSATIPVTVQDDSTPAASLVVTATTSNQALVPNANVVLGGSGASRMARITPLPNQNGVVDVTVTVHDAGGLQASTTFTLTVTPVNDAPVNAVPGPQTSPEDTPLPFSSAHGNGISVSDVDAGASPIRVVLTATGGTLSVSLIPTVSIVSGANNSPVMTLNGIVPDLNQVLNSLTFIPTPGTSGPATLEVFTNDLGNTGAPGARIDDDTIAITVTAVNDPPVAQGES
jgi:cadherin-like protein